MGDYTAVLCTAICRGSSKFFTIHASYVGPTDTSS